MLVHDLPTPALVIDADALEANLATMAAVRPGAALRPHVKAHKCTALARRQYEHGHRHFTCATPREAIGMAAADLGADLLIANEVLDPRRLTALADLPDDMTITVAIDSDATLDASVLAGVRTCVIDVDVGLPRCGCAPADAGRLADAARRRGLQVRGVMGSEGHLMMVEDRDHQRERVEAAMALLLAAHGDVGGELVSAGGTGTFDLHDRTGVTEVQAGSYALMDSAYARLGLPFGQAVFVVGTVLATKPDYAVADVGLKALGMDHGNPSIAGAQVWFCSDEHVTFATAGDDDRPGDDVGDDDGTAAGTALRPGDRVRVVPAHVDPTMALHEAAWLVRGEEVLERWPIDLRGWG
jgi:D-serine deaminase-like pyridoxal phosphate-dependent protein